MHTFFLLVQPTTKVRVYVALVLPSGPVTSMVVLPEAGTLTGQRLETDFPLTFRSLIRLDMATGVKGNSALKGPHLYLVVILIGHELVGDGVLQTAVLQLVVHSVEAGLVLEVVAHQGGILESDIAQVGVVL